MAREPYRQSLFLRKLQCAFELLPITLQRDPSYSVRPGGWGSRHAEFLYLFGTSVRVQLPPRRLSAPVLPGLVFRDVVPGRARLPGARDRSAPRGDESMARFLMEVGQDCARRRAELDRRACLASCSPDLLPRHLVVRHILPFI